MDHEEAVQRLNAVAELIDTMFNAGLPMLATTERLLERIQSIALGTDEDLKIKMPKLLEHVIISCDASITKNPGGTVSAAAIIEYKNEKPIEICRIMRKSSTNNEGEYDAVYLGLTQLMALKNNPGCEIEVRSDSKLVVDQINGKMKCNKPELQKKRDLILELIQQIPVPVSLQWRPRNSTPALEKANFAAQDALGVSRH